MRTESILSAGGNLISLSLSSCYLWYSLVSLESREDEEETGRGANEDECRIRGSCDVQGLCAEL